MNLKCLGLALLDTMQVYKDDVISFASAPINSAISRNLNVSRMGVIKSRFLYSRLKYGQGLYQYYSPLSSNNEGKLVRLVIQEHKAKKAGLHYDYRFHIKDKIGNVKAYSWVTKKGVLPTEKTQMIRTGDHDIKWSDKVKEEGIITISDGYGEGVVKTVFDEQVLITKCNDNEFQFIHGRNKYTWIQKDNKWLSVCSPVMDQKAVRLDKQKYSSESKKIEMVMRNEQGKYIYETKKNGANITASKDGYKVRLVSNRISIDGSIIDRTYNFPQIQKMISKLPDQTVLQGELVYEFKDGRQSPGIIAGLMNSLTIRAINTLNFMNDGKVKFYAFDVYKYQGKDVSKLPYSERRAILEDLHKTYKIDIPEKSTDGFKLYHKVVSKDGEGIVGKPLDGDYNMEIVKIKKIDTLDCKIVGTFEGQGKYKDNGIGGFIVEYEGRSIRVGTGLSDYIRQDAYVNQEKYLGQTVEVGVEMLTDNSALKPRLVGFHCDKNLSNIVDEQDLIDYAKAVNPEDPNLALYALKSATGWRK